MFSPLSPSSSSSDECLELGLEEEGVDDKNAEWSGRRDDKWTRAAPRRWSEEEKAAIKEYWLKKTDSYERIPAKHEVGDWWKHLSSIGAIGSDSQEYSFYTYVISEGKKWLDRIAKERMVAEQEEKRL